MPVSHSSFVTLSFMMLVAGLGIPVMAAVTAGLGVHLHSPVAASVILFAVGLTVSLLILWFVGVPAVERFRAIPFYMYAGALVVVFYILSITFAAPRIGVGNAVFFVLLGQLVAAAAIDHFGWFGALQSSLTGRRMLGLLLMTAGLYFARRVQ